MRTLQKLGIASKARIQGQIPRWDEDTFHDVFYSCLEESLILSRQPVPEAIRVYFLHPDIQKEVFRPHLHCPYCGTESFSIADRAKCCPDGLPEASGEADLDMNWLRLVNRKEKEQ